MNTTTKRTRSTAKKRPLRRDPTKSLIDLAGLGGGEIAYIKHMQPDEAHELFPSIEGLPRGIELYSLHAADGTPLAITDTRQAAVEHAISDELAIATLH
jgi:hypothetical protein